MKFTSLFGSDKEITEAQFLAELICKKCAEKRKTVLPNKFWTNPNYGWWKKKNYQENLAANRLLKAYSVRSIISAINDKDAYWIQSLFNKDLIPIIEKYELITQSENEVKKEEPVVEKPTYELTQMIKPFGKKSKFSKLKD